MNNDSFANSEIHVAIEKALTDYYATTSDPPELAQRIWQQVAPWLTNAREGFASAPMQAASEGNSSLVTATMNMSPTRNLPAISFRVIAAIMTLILIVLFMLVLIPMLAHF